jgi:NAD(P)-dependent dehydrogenase (short-subunit alcohol dehydrogenase family)
VAGRLVGRTAIVTGAGQTPGATIGNGRAIALVYAREGARVLCVDRDLARAEETVAMILAEGGRAEAEQADVSSDMDCRTVVAAGLAFGGGRLDILVNNVGIGGGGDGPAHKAEEAAFDRILAVNLKGAWLMTRHALLPMRSHGAGAIVNVSSLASIAGATQIAYEISKAAVNRLTTSVASANAGRGVRCNAILPGFLDTPMAVEGIAAATGQTAEAVREARNARVPLVRRMGTAWDTAHAALFLASDDAGFITGVLLPVDGGMGVRVG